MRCMAADVAVSKGPFQADVGQRSALSIRQFDNLRTMDSADFELIARLG